MRRWAAVWYKYKTGCSWNKATTFSVLIVRCCLFQTNENQFKDSATSVWAVTSGVNPRRQKVRVHKNKSRSRPRPRPTAVSTAVRILYSQLLKKITKFGLIKLFFLLLLPLRRVVYGCTNNTVVYDSGGQNVGTPTYQPTVADTNFTPTVVKYVRPD